MIQLTLHGSRPCAVTWPAAKRHGRRRFRCATWDQHQLALGRKHLIVPHPQITRRDFCALTATGIASLVLGSACRRTGGSPETTNGRLTARPRAGVQTTPADRIIVGAGPTSSPRDAILQLPRVNDKQTLLPLLVMLHGATQNAEQMFWYLGSSYEEAGVAVLAPNSRDTTWDAIRGEFGPDVEYLNRVLEGTFNLAAIDPARVAIGGFSDGASYAISLGLINGDFFRSVIAF